jgi:Lon protease-like protein
LQFAPKNPVPIFPLQDAVLFPRATLPVHVAELRYRTMVRDVLSGERMIALGMVKPGGEPDEYGCPDCFETVSLARVEEVEWLPNDCYDLTLRGLSRARISRVIREFPYRSARLELVPQEPYTEDDPLVQMEKQSLIETLRRWRAAVPGLAAARDPDGESLPFDQLVNDLCMRLDLPPLEKLQLLELDSIVERGHRVRDLAEQLLRRRSGPAAREGDRN